MHWSSFPQSLIHCFSSREIAKNFAILGTHELKSWKLDL
jgi:hypothetical protein